MKTLSRALLLLGFCAASSHVLLAQQTRASLLDLTTNSVISTFAVGDNPAAVAWFGDNLAYVVNDEDDTLVRLDMTTSPPTITSTFAFASGFGPHGLAINGAGTRALVSGDDLSVFLVDLTTTPFTIADTISIPTLDANGVAFYISFVAAPGGGSPRGVIVNETNLLFLNLAVVPAVVTTVSLGTESGLAIKVNPLGTRAAVTLDHGGLQLVDLTTTPPSLIGGPVGPLGPPQPDPLGVAISPDGTRAIYVDETSPAPEANVINMVTPGLVNSVPMTVISPSAVAFNPVTAAALVAGDDGVAILNPPYTAVNATIVHANLHGATAYSLAVNASGTRALVLHEDPIFCSLGFFIDFGNVPVGTTAGPITNTCTNEGVGPIQVTAFTFGGTGFGLTGQPSVPFTLPPGGSFSFGVTFTPPVVGPQSGFVDIDEVIVNTGLTRTEGIGLAGVGVGGPTPTPTIPGPTPTPGPGPSTAIPTLSSWMMAVLGFLLAGLGIFFVTRSRG